MSEINTNIRQDLTSDRIQDVLYGFTRSKLAFAAIELDIFSKIKAGHNTLNALLNQLEADPRALRMFLDGLVGIGFLTKKPNTDGKPPERVEYLLPEDVEHFMTTQSEGYLGGMVEHCRRLADNWAQLSDCIRTGMPSGGAQSLAHIEEYFSGLVKGLYVSNFSTAKKLATALAFSSTEKNCHILDVAGGSGVWSIAMLEADKTSRATILDYPTVIEVAKQYVERHGLGERFEYLPGDLEVLDYPKKQFDLAVVAHICHAIGPKSTADLINSVAGSLKPQGRIVVVDFLPDVDRAMPGWPLIFGVNMLISTDEGDVFTRQQYQTWFQNAGMALVDVFELDSEVSVIIGEKISDTKVYQFDI